MDPLTGGLLGVVLGMRHALEADHLSAVSTLIAEHRSVRKGALLGVFWGIGHSLAIFAVGFILILLRRDLPHTLSETFELAVAVMLVLLGGRALLRARLETHDHPHSHSHSAPIASRPLGIGVVHGLAGSGALTALACAKLPSASAQLLYLMLFGLGSVVGMALLSGLVGWPLARLGRNAQTARLLCVTSGFLAAGLGVAWAWPILSRWIG
jgi:hypothetical protein